LELLKQSALALVYTMELMKEQQKRKAHLTVDWCLASAWSED
jgi:hypothetical protein